MYKTTIKIPIYELKLTVIVAEEIEIIIKKYLKKFKMDQIDDTEEYHGLAVLAPSNQFYIFYNLHSVTPNYVAHEISHIVDYIVDMTEVEKSGETRAYLTGFIAEKVFDLLLKHKLLISKHLDFIQKPALVAEGSKAPVCNTVQPLVQIQPSAQNQIDGSEES